MIIHIVKSSKSENDESSKIDLNAGDGELIEPSQTEQGTVYCMIMQYLLVVT